MSWPADLSAFPLLLTVGWLVRAPLVSREEGHEAITRAAWEGFDLAPEQHEALIRGVRAPDVSPVGFLVSLLPFGQPRHALRAWSGTSTEGAVREIRAFLGAAHDRAMALPDGAGRWTAVGEVLHCLQDSYSPAHADRVDGRIVRVKHWGPLDALRHADEHRFPSDRRDSTWKDGALTDEALAGVAASRRYLEVVTSDTRSEPAFAAFLDGCVPQ